MKLFVDNTLSPHMARAVNAIVSVQFGDAVVALRDKFDQAISDEDWMSGLAAEGGWSFLTADYRIRKSRAEREAFRRSGLTGYFLSRGLRKRPVNEIAGPLLMRWPKLREHDALATGGLHEVPAPVGARPKPENF